MGARRAGRASRVCGVYARVRVHDEHDREAARSQRGARRRADARGALTVLPPGPEPRIDPIPDTAPRLALQREAAGPIVLRCDACDQWKRTIVPMDGAVRFGTDLRIVDLEWTKPELDVGFVETDSPSVALVPMHESLATAWSNVASVTRVSSPDRALGWKLLAGAGIATALGVFGLVDGSENHRGVSTGFGVAGIVLAVPLAIGGAWSELAPAHTSVLYGEEEKRGASVPSR